MLHSNRLLTHITLLGEPMEEPGGEMDASDRRLCCEGKQKQDGCLRRGKLQLLCCCGIHLHTLSRFSALAACLHNGCHTSDPTIGG